MEDDISNNPACDNAKLEAGVDSSVENGVANGEGLNTPHKPFKTIDEQIEILNRRGLLTDDNTHLILEREGYYPVVNGYKDFFLDSEAVRSAGEDIYLPGVRLTTYTGSSRSTVTSAQPSCVTSPWRRPLSRLFVPTSSQKRILTRKTRT